MAIGDAPLVGRADELRQLAALVGLSDAADEAPAGRVVLLGGDAGSGKTRLSGEIARRAVDRGWRTLTGHCLDFGDGSPPYLPFSEALGRLASEEPALVRSLVEASPAIERLHPSHRLMTDPDAAQEPTRRAALLEAVHDSLCALALDAPLLLVIEDLHWADQSSRDLLHWLFARRFDRPVTLLCTYRSDDLHRRHPLRANLAEWSRLPGVARLQLGPLAASDARSLVHALQTETISERDVRQILMRAEGNPFFIEELVAAVTTGDGRLPVDLADLLLVRLEQLQDEARLVVRAASVAGRRVSHQLLAEGTDLDPSTLDSAVRAAVEANILVSADGEHYAFRHALLAEAIYQDLLPGERVRLHAAYAAALASGAVDGSAAELSRHAWASHDLVTATRASIQAGQEAMAVGGPEEAIRHYERALELMEDREVAERLASDEADPVDRIGLVVRASAAAAAAGHLARAVALAHDELNELPDEAAATDRARLIHCLATTALVMDHNLDLLSLTTEAVRLMSDQPPSPLHAHVLDVHARAMYDRARDDEAARWAGEALQMARQLGLPAVVSDVTILLARIDERSGDAQGAFATVEAAVREARSAGEPYAELRGLYTLGSLLYSQGRLSEAIAAFDRAAQRANALGRQWAPYGMEAVLFGAIAAHVAGDWTRASQLVDATGGTPPEIAAALFEAVRLEIAAGRGDTTVLSAMPRLRARWALDGLVALMSASAGIELFSQAGDLAAAVAIHDEVVEFVSSLWQRPGFNARVRLAALLTGCVASAAADAPATERARMVERTERVVVAAREVAAAMRSPGPEGRAWAARLEAECLRLHWLSGVEPLPDADELVARWREAVAEFEAFGHVYETARSRARLAAALAATGDSAQAEAERQAALEVATSLGAGALLAELRGQGTAAPAEPARGGKPRDSEALTPREQEVLDLVATGRSNREIAAALFISAKTVSVHISNLLAKLEAGSRTEAVAVARRRGLLS
ncbi:MAG TPA: AAA family ATPase [Mycobacteriales bacterium]|nr:AAA family ATPase [Mycobacteriales bacterium]